MTTVTYNNQSAIHKTRGAVPLVGTAYLYTVSKLLWPKEVEEYLSNQLVGYTLHICCGKSKLGDVRLDMYEPVVNIRADASDLPFCNQSFDTVIIDPPYNGIFKWNHSMLAELSRVSRNRIIFQHWFVPVDKIGRYRKNHNFILTELSGWMPKTYFGRMQMISIFDRRDNEYYG